MAELYDSRELPGPPTRPEADGELPEHLPGVGEMSEHEKACALAAHVGADLASLRQALGLETCRQQNLSWKRSWCPGTAVTMYGQRS